MLLGFTRKEPPVKGIVRMPFLRGHWILWPSADGRTTRVEYQVHANPGGALPNWLVNYVSRDRGRLRGDDRVQERAAGGRDARLMYRNQRGAMRENFGFALMERRPSGAK